MPTAHGAKGLQANIVFIADTCSPPRRQRDPKILWQQSHDGVPGFVLWQAFRDNEEAVSRALREATHREIEREYRRLLYVAMTRAKDHLTLGVPLRFYVTQQGRNGDRHVYATRTRFIPKAMLGRFEQVTWSPLPRPGASGPAPQRIDVSARMRQMWG